MEDLRGLEKGQTSYQKCEKYYYMGYLRPIAALYNLICIIFFCFTAFALYRLLHNKSYLPDL